MKKIILSLSIIALLASCTDKGAYTLKGTLSGATETPDNTKVYLYEDAKSTVALDSTTIIGGKFEFKGSQLQPTLRFIGTMIGGETPIKLPLVLEPGEISFIGYDDITITGTPTNNAKRKYEDDIKNINQQMKFLNEEINSISDEDPKRVDLIAQGIGVRTAAPASLISFVKKNANNPAGPYILATNSYLLDLDQMKELIALVPESQKSTKHIIALAAKIAAQESTLVGKKFVDIKGLTLNDVEASLSDYAGKDKVVLLDFWASWCSYCIKELPNLKKVYSEYKSKGFEVVGVSLDNTKAEWQAATDRYEVVWPQFSNIQYWDDPAAKAYGVGNIPHTVLIDKDGTIVAKDLKGDEISKKLDELLK